MKNLTILWIVAGLFFFGACSADKTKKEPGLEAQVAGVSVTVPAANLYSDGLPVSLKQEGVKKILHLDSAEAVLPFQLEVPKAGRYQIVVSYQLSGELDGSCWIEDYTDNQDYRTYNVTGSMPLTVGETSAFSEVRVDGSPLNQGLHPMRLHLEGEGLKIEKVDLRLMIPAENTPHTLTQHTEGENWELVWSDEFEGKGLPILPMDL